MTDELITSYNETCGVLHVYECGIYVVGTDIPLGGYAFSASEKQGSVRIYARYKDYLTDRSIEYFTIRKNAIYISLREEGIVVKVIGCVMKKEQTAMEQIEAKHKKMVAPFLLGTINSSSEKKSEITCEWSLEESSNERGTDEDEEKAMAVNYREIQEFDKDDFLREFFTNPFE